jgi:WXXGXW repeat (2 copies)
VQASQPPPPLPDYDQPPCPEDGYLWTPGYWHWTGSDYYWIPGTWVQPPQVGVLWTPGYWGFVGGFYGWHAGYWGPHVGFYGGVNYGFGYVGVGFVGGRWAGNSFAYNTAVNHVNVTVIHNTYNQTVVNNVTVNKVSYNGGAGGVAAVPTPQERAVAQERHVPPTALQRQHVQEAVRNPALSARANGGHPSIAATSHPGAFSGPGVVGAHGAAMPPPRGVGTPGGAPGAPGSGHSPPGVGQANGAHVPPNGVAHPGVANGHAPGQKAGAPKPPPRKAQPEGKRHEPDKKS